MTPRQISEIFHFFLMIFGSMLKEFNLSLSVSGHLFREDTIVTLYARDFLKSETLMFLEVGKICIPKKRRIFTLSLVREANVVLIKQFKRPKIIHRRDGHGGGY